MSHEGIGAGCRSGMNRVKVEYRRGQLRLTCELRLTNCEWGRVIDDEEKQEARRMV
ncbi:MAG: hypothetical protein ACOZCO_01730 [Bacteroidota bacterium]